MSNKIQSVGFIGIGKLGMPCAEVMAQEYNVTGYDIYPKKSTKITISETLEGAVRDKDVVFVAVQTPHDKIYDGSQPISHLPNKDFDYTIVNQVLADINQYVTQDQLVVLISTVLPGTLRKYIFPVLSEKIHLCYNPYFIAMGTTVRDFLYPEFILFGVVDENAKNKAIEFYKTITDSPVYATTLENAELIKVSYNTMISTKITFVNILMEMCDKLPNTNVDEVTNALKMANRRLISPMYLNGGMSDGGGCHPRDNIALSWLSKELDLSLNFFDSIMIGREKQTEYLADIICNKFK